MAKSKRNWVSCHRCGKDHTNPASSSCCASCNEIYFKEKIEQEARRAAEDEKLRTESYSTVEAVDALLEALLGSQDVLPIELIERVKEIQEKLDHSL